MGSGRPKVLVTLALQAFAHKLAMPASRLGLLTCPTLRRLLVVPTKLHLTKDTLALHLLLERAQSLINVIVADGNVHGNRPPELIQFDKQSSPETVRPPEQRRDSIDNRACQGWILVIFMSIVTSAARRYLYLGPIWAYIR